MVMLLTDEVVVSGKRKRDNLNLISDFTVHFYTILLLSMLNWLYRKKSDLSEGMMMKFISYKSFSTRIFNLNFHHYEDYVAHGAVAVVDL